MLSTEGDDQDAGPWLEIEILEPYKALTPPTMGPPRARRERGGLRVHADLANRLAGWKPWGRLPPILWPPATIVNGAAEIYDDVGRYLPGGMIVTPDGFIFFVQ